MRVQRVVGIERGKEVYRAGPGTSLLVMTGQSTTYPLNPVALTVVRASTHSAWLSVAMY